MSPKKIHWTAVCLWTVFIYAFMLGGRSLIDFLRSHTDFPILFFSLCTVLAALFVLFLFYYLALRKPSTYLLLLAAFLPFTWFLFRVKELEEIAHYFEYGVLSAMIYAALSIDWKAKRAWIFAFLIAAGIGVLEEVIQLWIPGRVFDLQDIQKNIIAVLFGLLFTAIAERERRMGPDPETDLAP